MKITLRRDININKPVEKVWRAVSDVVHYPCWCTFIHEIVPVGEDKEIAPGRKYIRKFNYGFPFGMSEEIITVIQVVPRRFFAFKHGNIFIKTLHLIYLKSVGQRTHVVFMTVYRGYLFFLVAPLWLRLRKLQNKFVKELKTYLETG